MGNIVIDTLSIAEDMASREILASVPAEKMDKGGETKTLADFPFGRGYAMLFDLFCKLIPELERHTRAGRNVILVAHTHDKPVKNPSGEDYPEDQPSLFDSGNHRTSIKGKFVQWCDHVIYVTHVQKVENGKVTTYRDRVAVPARSLGYEATVKSRTLNRAIPLEIGSTYFWDMLLMKEN